MTNQSSLYIQTITEKTTYTVDYTDNLPTGGTITGGTATHIPPSGTASVPAVQVSSPYLYVTFQPTVLGVHYIDVLATFSDTDTANVRVAVNVVYPSPVAREGMADWISEERELCDLGLNDYTIANIPYWNDVHIQNALDEHAWSYSFYEVEPRWVNSNGVLETYDYYLPARHWESGAEFYIQDATGGTVTNYTVDYRNGIVSFDANTNGAIYYVTGSAYDLHAAAANIWQKKAGHYALSYNFSSDNHSMSREVLMKHCMDMHEFYASMSAEGAGTTELVRDDTN